MNRDRLRNTGRRQAASDGPGSSQKEPVQNGRDRQRGRPDGDAGKKNWFLRHKVFSIILGSVLVLMIAGVAAAMPYINAIRDPGAALINRTADPQTPEQTEEPIDPTATATETATENATASPDLSQAPTEEPPPDLSVFPKNIVNVLMLGTDTGLGRVGMGSRTDCIMLVSINTATSKVSIISIPRDTYVKIYNEKMKLSGRNRVNAAFAYGGGQSKKGIPYAINTVSHFLGSVPIDHYVIFNMDLVMKLINTVGGVTVDVQLNKPLDFGSVHLKPGVQKLNGYEALTYARDRHNTTGGDFGRVGHQQQVMVAVLKELKKQGKISMIPQIYNALKKNVQTDLSAEQIAALAWIAKGVDTDATIGNNSYTIQGSSLMINGASIVIADQQKKIDVLKKVFGANSGLNFKIYADESKSYLQGIIKSQFQSGQGIVNSAKSLLANNTKWYTSAEAAPLRAAIAAWEAASKKNDADGMADAQQDVQTQYDILKGIIAENKAAANTPPPATDTPTDEPTDNPTEPPTQEPTQPPTEEPTQAPTEAASESPASSLLFLR